MKLRVIFISSLLLLQCGTQKNIPPVSFQKKNAAPEFTEYWVKSGKAELSRFELQQARYGNMNKGNLVLIMVTEPFDRNKQVKADSYDPNKTVQVLKAQTTRYFTTGIYDYTMTTTSFKPYEMMENPNSLKIIGSSVEWCGQTFFQLNSQGGKYKAESRSYFESESDKNFELKNTFSEDEIWQRIRINPEQLPQGSSIEIIPSLVSTRLRHLPLQVENALAILKPYAGKEFKGAILWTYELKYSANTLKQRTVEFIFEKEFPHKIVGFTEEYYDGFQNPKLLKTIATLKNQIRLDYWRTHDPQHEVLRKEFGLTP